MGVQILVSGVTPAFATAPPRADVTTFYDVDEWTAAGLAFWGRGDGVDPTPGSGVFEVLDRRISSARVLNQAAGASLTQPAPSSAILGGRAVVKFNSLSTDKLVLSTNVLPTTGPFAIYLAAHGLGIDRVLGNNATGQFLGLQINGGTFLFAVEAAELAGKISYTPTVSPTGKNVALAVIRDEDNHLRMRYFSQGAVAWEESVSAGPAVRAVGGAACPIATSLAIGDNTGSAGAYASSFSLGGVIVHIGAMSEAVQAEYEDYLVGYYGLV